MRDYVFHGKRIDTDEWVEGHLSYNKVRKQYYIMDDVNSFPIPVHQGSVGQYTGMNDKNGRKIFEGDIVRTQPCSDRPYSKKAKFKEHIGVVRYHIRHFKNRFHEQDYEAEWIVDIKDRGEYGCYDWSMFFKCEVIGTEFENADLLEG